MGRARFRVRRLTTAFASVTVAAMKVKAASRRKTSQEPVPEGKEIRFLGKKLKSLMGYFGLANYRELARRTGIGFETLRLLHTGIGSNPNIKNLYPLAKFYDVPLEILINDTVPAEDILQWVGTRFVMDQPEVRLRCPNLRRMIKTAGYNQIYEKISAHYYEKDGTLVCLTVGRNGDILYQGSERRRPPAGIKKEF
jgi:transcriptional regulator with XRE-family HTH domain